MSNKITGFFKKLSLSRLPRASSLNELLSSQESEQLSQESVSSSSETVVAAESQNSPVFSSFLSSCTIEIELSQKFNTENYKPLIAISKIITSSKKPEISDVFFTLEFTDKR